MNNSMNVQSPAFGMAFIVKDLPKVKEYASKLSKEEKQKFAEGLRYAEEKLGTKDANKTPMSDLKVFVNSEGELLYKRETENFAADQLTGDLQTYYTTTGGGQTVKNGLKSLVDETVLRNNSARELYEKVAKECAEIKQTNKELDAALDLFAKE